MPAKHLEWMTECNETGSLRWMNNQKLWDEINIIQKIYLFLLSLVNTEQWGEWKASWEVLSSFQNTAANIPYICIMHSSSHVLFYIPLEILQSSYNWNTADEKTKNPAS